jgi:hypothetical protein
MTDDGLPINLKTNNKQETFENFNQSQSPFKRQKPKSYSGDDFATAQNYSESADPSISNIGIGGQEDREMPGGKMRKSDIKNSGSDSQNSGIKAKHAGNYEISSKGSNGKISTREVDKQMVEISTETDDEFEFEWKTENSNKSDVFGTFLQKTKPAKMQKANAHALKVLDMAAEWLSSQRSLRGGMTIADSSLGKIDVKFRAADKEVRVKLEVENDEAKAALASNLNNFTKGLKNQGFSEVSVDIESKGQESQQFAQERSFDENQSQKQNQTNANLKNKTKSTGGIFGFGEIKRDDTTLQVVA